MWVDCVPGSFGKIKHNLDNDMQKYNLTCQEKDTRLTGTPSNERC